MRIERIKAAPYNPRKDLQPGDPTYVAVILERLTGMGLSPHRMTRDEA